MSAPCYNAASQCRLRHPAKAVLKELAWFANDRGENAYPSVGTIADRTGLSRRAVQKMLRELEAGGLITAVNGKQGGRMTTKYRLNLALLARVQRSPLTSDSDSTSVQRSPLTSDSDTSSVRPRGDQQTTGANGRYKGGVPGSPEQKLAVREQNREYKPCATDVAPTLDDELEALASMTTPKRMPSSLTAIEAEARRAQPRMQAEELRAKGMA